MISYFDSAETIETLRQKIRRLEGFKATKQPQPLHLGVCLGDSLPGSALSCGSIHEFISADYEDAAATIAFTLTLLSRLPPHGTIVWVGRDPVHYAPGFALFGVDPQRIIFARPQKDADALWVMEESLRCKGISAVTGECALADLTATRRLQLAAEESGAFGLLLRPLCREPGTSSCVTRWQIKHAPSVPGKLPGLGHTRWQVELLKARGGKPGNWMMEYHDHKLSLVAPLAQEVRQLEKTSGDILPFSLRA